MKVDAQAVKQLRQMSGAGMMDAKKALQQTGGDVDKALESLRKKGLASADKKAGRLASEGAIGAYIHAGSRCAAPSGPSMYPHERCWRCNVLAHRPMPLRIFRPAL